MFTMTLAVSVLVTMAVVVLLAYWLMRWSNSAAAAEAQPAIARRPLPPDCEVGRQLQMASAAGTAGTGTARGSGERSAPADVGGGKQPKRRKKPSAPSRRAFLRSSMAVGWLGVLGGFGAASLAFLWPDLRGGFGAVLEAGDLDEILDHIKSEKEPYEFAEGRTYLVAYDESEDPEGEYADITNGAPVMALFWTCVHLGCKVPWCQSSQWLECGCHGSKYNRWGEYEDGPAPRGLDRFKVEVTDDNKVNVDTSEIITGPPRVIDVLQQAPEGPNCT